MKYKYKFLYGNEVEPNFIHVVDLPYDSKIISVMVETNLLKRSRVRLTKGGGEILFEIPIFKNLWFPLDVENRGNNLRLDFINTSKTKKYIRVYAAWEELGR